MITLESGKKKITKREWILMSYLILHLTWYMLMEQLNDTTEYMLMYCTFDDLIPFCKWFFIPYISWFPYMVIPGFYFLLKDDEAFENYLLTLWIGFFFSMLCCTLFVTGQELRPAVLEGNDFLSRLITRIYAFDTNTNVFPSMHVVGAVSVGVAIFNSKTLKKKVALQIFNVLLSSAIILSTVFMKQHSVLDVFGGLLFEIPVCIVVYKGWPSKLLDKLTKTERPWLMENTYND